MDIKFKVRRWVTKRQCEIKLRAKGLWFIWWMNICINEAGVIFNFPSLSCLPENLLKTTKEENSWKGCVFSDEVIEGNPYKFTILIVF